MRAPEALPRAAVPNPAVPNPAASVLARLRAARLRAARVPTPAPEPKKRAAGGGRRSARLVLLMAVSALVPFLTGVGEVFAAEIPNAALQVDLGEGAGAASAVKLLVTLTFLAVLPALVLSMTSFTRLIVVFSMLRQALAVQQAPPNQILVGLALFLTWFIMGPTFEQVHDMAVEPYMDGQMSEVEAVEAAMGPMRDFMLRNTRANDLALFLQISRTERPETRADVPTRVLVPAFLISELKTAFQIGFLIYIPFLVIDLVVSTVLLAMGMMVLPPVVISLPFKLLLFVFVDGWNLLAGSLVKGFA
jgi:flagellar biosynthetic protein FliP